MIKIASSGYMTEATLKSIWDHLDIDDTRFSNANTRIGGIINFLIHADADADITDTAITPVLAEISEEIYLELEMAAKLSKVTDPWDFMNVNILSFVIKKYRENTLVFDMIRKAGGYVNNIDIENLSGFGASSDL